MKVVKLSPLPTERTQFAWSHHVTVPAEPGCYALVAYDGEVLYVGLATTSIRSRMGNHLDSPEKRKGSSAAVPFWFHYLVRKDSEVSAIERGWLQQAVLEDGEMPFLNRVWSPM